MLIGILNELNDSYGRAKVIVLSYDDHYRPVVDINTARMWSEI